MQRGTWQAQEGTGTNCCGTLFFTNLLLVIMRMAFLVTLCSSMTTSSLFTTFSTILTFWRLRVSSFHSVFFSF